MMVIYGYTHIGKILSKNNFKRTRKNIEHDFYTNFNLK